MVFKFIYKNMFAYKYGYTDVLFRRIIIYIWLLPEAIGVFSFDKWEIIDIYKNNRNLNEKLEIFSGLPYFEETIT